MIADAADLRTETGTFKGYIETPWRGLTVSGHVELPGGIVTCFAAERRGVPVRVADADMPSALAELVAAMRELCPECGS